MFCTPWFFFLFSFGSTCNIFILPLPVISRPKFELNVTRKPLNVFPDFLLAAEENALKGKKFKIADQAGTCSSVWENGYKYH